MDANKSDSDLFRGEEKERSVPHMPNSECEEIVYTLAKCASYHRLAESLEVLCPTCRHNFRELLTLTSTEQIKARRRQILAKKLL